MSTTSEAAAVRVLVVDDEPAIRLLCRVNLEASGMEVFEAEDGEAALSAARRHSPDLILLDVMMPSRDGWDVARKLTEAQGPPIVFLTALADDSARVKAYEHGAVGYILKPFDPVALAEFVKRTISRINRGELEALRHTIFSSGGDLHVES